MMKQKTAVVGFGCAGYHGVKAMREHGYDGEIDVYTDSPWAPANPMLPTSYIYGKLPREATCPFGTLEELAVKYHFHAIAEPVEKVHSEERSIQTRDGAVKRYDQLLIATGARAFVPPIEGLDCKNVFSMRTMEDAGRVKKVLQQEKIESAVVVGASMAGIKLVELFHARGITCTLVDMAPGIFPIAAVPCIASEIEDRLREKGVRLAFSKALERIEEAGGKRRLVFADGERIPCDLVMMCIGTRANTEIADDKLKINRGIVVDERMQTNMPGIYCAGDCSEGPNLQTKETQIIGLWDNAAKQGRTAGANMAGIRTVYQGNMPHNITHFMGMDFIGYGDVRSKGREYVYENRERGQKFFLRMEEGKPVCMNFLDSFGASGVLKSYMLRKINGGTEPPNPAARVRLLHEGIPRDLIELLMKEG